MTITLAAVYTPIGLQGGLTGSLFREFAFTLAGAVFISGVVALDAFADDVGEAVAALACRSTASPARSIAPSIGSAIGTAAIWIARLQRASGGLHRLDRALLLADSHVHRMPMFADKELAPTEDQGVIFGIIDAPANATIDQRSDYADAAGQSFR